MFRNFLVSLIAVFALLAGLAPAPKAEASHRHPAHSYARCYHVMYRDCNFEPWRCYGRYDCYHEAQDVACYLRRQGFSVYIR